jgi:hypothetical protein
MIASPLQVAAEQDQAANRSSSTRTRKPWQPGERDHLAYEWTRFRGKPQWWVAHELGVDQSTVSRIVARYEKWLAHSQPGESGQLDPAERQRVQRWLTYERNERILASALRIAGDMESLTDVSRSVVSRPMGEPDGEREVRTYHSVLDRSGLAARFLRLAFQINMQQLKLTEQEPLPPLPPLSEDEQLADDSLSSARAELEVVGSDAENDPAATEPVQTESLKLHNVHNGPTATGGAKERLAGTCVQSDQRREKTRDACIEESEPLAKPNRPPREVLVLPCGINPFG